MKKNKTAAKSAICLILSFLVIGCTVLAAKASFTILEQKRDNPLYFADCLSPSFNPENSEAVNAEIKTLTEKILTYTGMKNDLTLFENAGYISGEIERLKRNTERSKADAVYFTEEKIKTDTLDRETVENGFVALSDNEADGTAVHFGGKLSYAKTDTETIEAYYAEKLDRQSEEVKLNASTSYREAKQYLDSLDDTEYCVLTADGECKSDGFSTNQTNSDRSVRVIVSSDGSVTTDFVTALSESQTAACRQAAEAFSGPFELTLLFRGSLLFNENLQSVAALHSECRSLVLSRLIAVVGLIVLSILSACAFAFLLPLAKKQKSGLLLPLLFTVLSAAVILLSVRLFCDSVSLFCNPTADTSWIMLDTGTIVSKACLRSGTAAVGALGLIASLKAAVIRKKGSKKGWSCRI